MPASTVMSTHTLPLADLSEQLHISRQTLVRWVDRNLIKATLGWSITDDDEEVRIIDLNDRTHDFLKTFAADYRSDVVTRKQAQRILKRIDRKRVKRMIRAGDLEAVESEEGQQIVVGSIEDYLMNQERERAEALS